MLRVRISRGRIRVVGVVFHSARVNLLEGVKHTHMDQRGPECVYARARQRESERE